MIDLTVTVECPHCGLKQQVNLEEYVISSEAEERNMGFETEYYIEAEEMACEKCHRFFNVEGSIWEYPEGTRNLVDVDVTSM